MPASEREDAAPEDLLRVLADPERLSVAGALASGPKTAGELSEAVGIPVQRVRRHLARLSGVGLVRPAGDRRTYRFDPETLRGAATEMGPSREAGLSLGAVDEEEEAVLRNYFRGGRLREIPARQAKRRIVLIRLSLEFDVGVRYPERAVNQTLRRFHEDHASLRRYLVDEGLLSREKGLYWRSGGPVEV
jgi:DNA-binding HxlR family transcriptional regulator